MHYSCLFEYCGDPINPHTIQYWSMFVCQKYPPFHCFTGLFAVLPVSLFSRKKNGGAAQTGPQEHLNLPPPPPAVRLFDSSHLGDAVGQTKQQDQTAEWRLGCNTQGGGWRSGRLWRRDLGSGWWLFVQCGRTRLGTVQFDGLR